MRLSLLGVAALVCLYVVGSGYPLIQLIAACYTNV